MRLLKIDAEGAEMAVLRGLQRTLGRRDVLCAVADIVVELTPSGWAQWGVSLDEGIASLRSLTGGAGCRFSAFLLHEPSLAFNLPRAVPAPLGLSGDVFHVNEAWHWDAILRQAGDRVGLLNIWFHSDKPA